jgi:hypothetical protein
MKIVYGKNRLKKTGQTISYTANDDGARQDGVLAEVHYTDNGDNTITDNTTGLMWVKDPFALGAPLNAPFSSYTAALAATHGLTLAGYNDWRVPNIYELESIVDYSRHNPMVDPAYFANPGLTLTSSTTIVNQSLQMCLSIDTDATQPTPTTYYVRPVRGGSCFGRNRVCLGSYVDTPVVGQGAQQQAYDDAYYHAGNSISPRFVDTGNGTISDRHSGLMWVKSVPQMITGFPGAVHSTNMIQAYKSAFTNVTGTTYNPADLVAITGTYLSSGTVNTGYFIC